MIKFVGFSIVFLAFYTISFGQVDTAYVYNTSMPYGTLDIRIARSASWYYYLQEGKTFSFRESAPGVRTNTFRDMTSWDSSPYTEGHLREKNGTADNFVMNYRLLKPENYNAAYPDGYPLLVVMHGSGERGNCWKTRCYWADNSYSPVTNQPPAPTTSDHQLLNNDHNLLHVGGVHLAAVKAAGSKLPNDATLPEGAFPGFVLVPQNLNSWTIPAVQDALRLVRLISKKYKIDPNRIYIHGYSNGGHGVFEAIKRAPWLFAAAATMSATDDGTINAQGMAPKIAHIPLWMFQGGLDTNPTPRETENYVKRFRDAGAIVRYTKYPEAGHNTWSKAYREKDFFKWFLGENKSEVHVFSGSPTICNGNGQDGLRLELGEGFRAYQWEKDGQVIPDATAYYYVATSPGTYRGRFSREPNPSASQWNKWSAAVKVTQEDAPKAEIKQIGTVLLRDLNNYNEARLEAVGDYAHYYWYKDGKLIDQPGDQDDTVKMITIKPGSCTSTCTGNGVYTLVTSHFGNCQSSATPGKYVFFNDQAPVNLTAPSNFKGKVESGSAITLSWGDASADEGGFEIWRRKKTDGALWEMATITGANATSFKDTGLEPMTAYQYKIRAVSNSGRSAYTPSGATEFLEVTSGEDKEAPEAPKLSLKSPSPVRTVKLSWTRSKDNTGIRQYYVYYGNDSIATNSTDTTYALSDLPLNKMYDIRVKAVDLGGNFSAFSNLVPGNTFVRGLYYEHSGGEWPEIDSINWANPEYSGYVDHFTLSPKTQDDYFNFRFDGYLWISTSGVYVFRTSSDDASRLKLDGKTIVDNDGIHNYYTVTSANQTLNKETPYRIQVEFFDYTLTDSLLVEYKGTDTNNEWKSIPSSALKSALVTSVAPEHSADRTLQVNVFPNPTSPHDLQIQVQSVKNAPVQVRLVDPIGRSIYFSEFDMHQLRDGTRLSPSEMLMNGIYIVIVNQGEQMVKQKVFIQN